MNRLSFALSRSALVVAILILGACSAAPPRQMASSPPMEPMKPMPMMSMVRTVTAQLSGGSEVPPLAGGGSGTLDATLDVHSGVLNWTLTYAGLSGPVVAGHFHGPAPAGQNAGPAVPLAGSLASPIRGSATLTAAQMADLRAGQWYVNLHTAANPGGEIRGQVTVQP
jgi:hypothetical protein